MLKILNSMSIEVTRRFNEACKHCMRGEPQNIDIDQASIDQLFSDDSLIIRRLIFSGGEPTLTPNIIIYTLDKIINERRKVLSIHITTNGLIYSEELIESLTSFAKYSKKVLSELQTKLGLYDIIDIRISNDQFHLPLPHTKYENLSPEYFHLSKTGPLNILDDNFLITGRIKNSFLDDNYIYSLKPLKVGYYDDIIYIANDFYLTATGFITNQGDGEYVDMDNINFGSIEHFSFDQIVHTYIGQKLKKTKKEYSKT